MNPLRSRPCLGGVAKSSRPGWQFGIRSQKSEAQFRLQVTGGFRTRSLTTFHCRFTLQSFTSNPFRSEMINASFSRELQPANARLGVSHLRDVSSHLAESHVRANVSVGFLGGDCRR